MVAGEHSGDLLGAAVIQALKQRYPDCLIEGIGGDAMIAEGCDSWWPMERLAVMGLIDPLKRLPELLRIRKTLKQRWLSNPPDVFLGIDAPDFNLPLETALKQTSVPTMHLVSPTVWAWRSGRVNTVEQACDDLLCLFPFESACYEGRSVRAHFVGHPMVDALHDLPAIDSIEQQLGLSGERPVLALLPGSRRQEIERLLPIYLEACRTFQEQFTLVIPASSVANKAIIEQIALAAKVPVMVIEGQSRELLKVAHFGVVTSGTATLEAALLGCPMVIAYRMSTLSWALMKYLIRTPYAGLPNILAGQAVVPELIQSDLTVPSLTDALATLSQEDARQAQQAAFTLLEQQLGANFGERCATVIVKRLEQAL